jgi:hypothetical protein
VPTVDDGFGEPERATGEGRKPPGRRSQSVPAGVRIRLDVTRQKAPTISRKEP